MNGTKVNTKIGDVTSPASKNPVRSPERINLGARTRSKWPPHLADIDENRLLTAYRASANDARRDLIAVAQAIAETSPRQRPALSLVRCAQAQRGGVA